MINDGLWKNKRRSKDCSLWNSDKWAYQQKLAKEIVKNCHNRKFVGAVLGAAVGSGKTTIIIHAINLIIRHNSAAKILFLTHAQNALKQQALDAFTNPPRGISTLFSFGILAENAQVHIAIPQEFKNLNKIENYSYVIVDEAHEWFASNSVLSIIKKLNRPKLILATGSVSFFNSYNKKFPQQRFAMTYISGEEIRQKGIYSALDIDLIKVTSHENIDEILSRFFKICRTDVNAQDRPVIVCESIDQASKVSKILEKSNYSVGLCTSDSDPNSQAISDFQSGTKTALILVNRGVLGLNVPTATSMLYLKSTKNVEIILQAMARLFRPSISRAKKYFYMTATSNEWNHKVILLHKVLMLNNLNTMQSFTG